MPGQRSGNLRGDRRVHGRTAPGCRCPTPSRRTAAGLRAQSAIDRATGSTGSGPAEDCSAPPRPSLPPHVAGVPPLPLEARATSAAGLSARAHRAQRIETASKKASTSQGEEPAVRAQRALQTGVLRRPAVPAERAATPGKPRDIGRCCPARSECPSCDSHQLCGIKRRRHHRPIHQQDAC